MPKKPASSTAPGILHPAKASVGPVKVLAWKDTDKKGAKPTYFLDIRMTGWTAHELIGLSPARIKALGEALIAIHDQLPKSKARKPSAE